MNWELIFNLIALLDLAAILTPATIDVLRHRRNRD